MEELTLDQLSQIKPGTIFASGILPNSPLGLNMVNIRQGDNLLWIAKKGYGHDWAIYCHWEEKGIDFVETQGDKVTCKEHIKKCVPCTEEVYNLYRK